MNPASGWLRDGFGTGVSNLDNVQIQTYRIKKAEYTASFAVHSASNVIYDSPNGA